MINNNENTNKGENNPNNKDILINNNELFFTDLEINSFSFEEAILNDKRTFFQYYISLIKTKQLLIFTFYPNNDNNSKIIKICLFLFSISSLYLINALFFTDKTMHKIYVNRGIFDFIYLIPQMIYSTIISSIINALVKFLSLINKIIINIKK